jgi:hypothetical protein
MNQTFNNPEPKRSRSILPARIIEKDENVPIGLLVLEIMSKTVKKTHVSKQAMFVKNVDLLSSLNRETALQNKNTPHRTTQFWQPYKHHYKPG